MAFVRSAIVAPSLRLSSAIKAAVLVPGGAGEFLSRAVDSLAARFFVPGRFTLRRTLDRVEVLRELVGLEFEGFAMMASFGSAPRVLRRFHRPEPQRMDRSGRAAGRRRPMALLTPRNASFGREVQSKGMEPRPILSPWADCWLVHFHTSSRLSADHRYSMLGRATGCECGLFLTARNRCQAALMNPFSSSSRKSFTASNAKFFGRPRGG